MTGGILHPSKAPLRGRFSLGLSLVTGLGLLSLISSWLAANHYPPWTSFHGEAAAFLALIALCSAQLAIAPSTGKQPAVVAVAAAAMLLLQWMAEQIVYGGDAVLSGLYLVGACWAWWAGRADAQRICSKSGVDPLTLLCVATLIGSCASTFVGVLQWLRMESSLGIFAADRGPDMRVFGNLGQPNHLATLCATAAVMGLWLYRSRQLKAWHLTLLLCWMALGVTMSESRAGLLGSAVAGVLVLCAGRTLEHRARLLAPVAGWWLLLLAGAKSWGLINAALYLQAGRTGQFSADNARMTMWQQSFQAIAESPWVGWGWRQTMLAQKWAAAKTPGSLATDYAHSLPLDLLIWVGIPAGLAILLAAGIFLLNTLRRVQSDREVFLLAMTVPFLVHSLVEFPFAYAYFLFPVAWLFGHLSGEQRSVVQSLPMKGAVKIQLGLAMCLYAGLAAIVWSEYLKLEEDYRVLRFELRNVGRTPADYARPEVHVLTQLDALVKVGRLVPGPSMPADQIEEMRIASERNGWATLDLAYAAALRLNGDVAESERRMERITSVYGPASGRQARQMLDELLIQRGLRATISESSQTK